MDSLLRCIPLGPMIYADHGSSKKILKLSTFHPLLPAGAYYAPRLRPPRLIREQLLTQ
jgi:hypothetical protein